MTKWSHDDRAAQERLKHIGAEAALRRVRNAEPSWHAVEAVDEGRLAALETAEAHATAPLAALQDIHDYCVRYKTRSRVAAEVGKLAAAALASSRRGITS